MELKHKLLKIKNLRFLLPLSIALFGHFSANGQCSATASFNGSLTGCSTVQFSDLSTAAFGYTIVQWDWDFGDGNTSNLQHPLHVYAPGSPYIVTLTVTADSSGTTCTDNVTNVITVPSQPTVYFTWNPEPTCVGGATSFFGTSGKPIVSWDWNFGDGQTSSIQNPVHLYVLPGLYTVTLMVTDVDGCSDTAINQVTIAAIPDVDFTFTPDPTCLNSITSFFGTSSAAVTSWTWDFGDGGTGFTQNAQHTYLSPGTYNATLTINDTSGCMNSVSYPVTVNPLPTANFFTNSPVCSDDSVNFTNISTSPNGYIAQWIWDFGDGTSTTINFPGDPNVSHMYPNAGTFQVTLTVTDSDSCVHTTYRDVIVVPKPDADFTFTSACNNQPVLFTDLSSPNGGNSIVSWYWEFDDPASGVNNTSNLQNPSHLFTSGGPFSVLLIVTNTDGCTDSISKPVGINGLPAVDITTDYDTVCVNAITNFYGSGASNIVTWAWTFGDGGTSVLQNPQHIYSSPGTYNVTLTAVDDQGCDSTATHTMTVNTLPYADFNTSAPSCEGAAVDFFDLSSAPGGWVTEWHWYFGDGSDTIVLFPDPPNVVHTYSSPGSYIASLVITSNALCVDSVTHEVNVSLSPESAFSTNGPMCDGNLIQFLDESLGFGINIQSWNWNFGDPASGSNNTSSLQNPFHLFSSPGTYSVLLEVMNANGCFDTISNLIEIYEPPAVYFNVDPSGGVCQNDTAFFTVNPDTTNIAAVVTYFWDFGDPASGVNNISSLPSPEHLFTTFGTFDVSLTITDTAGCSNSIILPVEVLELPIPDFIFTAACFGDSTYFTDQSIPGATIINEWFWKFNDVGLAPGDTSDLQNPGFMFSSIDDYFVELTVTDNNGCSNTSGRWIQVYDTPQAAFSFDQFCNPPGLVQFDDESTYGASGSPLQSWEWELDDGYFSSEINPSYIYDVIDTCYIINLTVTDENMCSDTFTDTICLFGEINADFTSTQVCYRDRTLFEGIVTPAGDSIASWKWNFGDGSPVVSTPNDTISYLYANPGTYLVTLDATSEFGCLSSTYHMVTVDSLPSPDFTSNVAFCDDATMFYDQSSGNGTFIASWEWDFGDPASGINNTSTEQYPSHLYDANDSTYFVTLKVSNYLGCYDSIIKEVYKGPCVSAQFEAIDPPFCSTYPVCFVNNSEFFGSVGGINEWMFLYGDGSTDVFITKPDTICHTYDDPGIYQVSFIIVADVNGNVYRDTAIINMEVSPSPTADFVNFYSCSNEETLFESISEGNGANIINWEWNFGDPDSDTDTSSFENPAYNYPYAGLFDVQLIVTSNNGCIDTLEQEIEIFDPPEADFSASNACVNEETDFFDESDISGADIFQWNWSFGDSLSIGDTSVIQDPTYTYGTTGKYNVTLMIEDLNQCRDTVIKEVTVNVVPEAGFFLYDNYEDTQGQIYLENGSIGADFYEWDFGNGETSEEVNPVVSYFYDGTYEIELIAINEFGCPDTSWMEYEILFKGLFIPNAFVPKGAEELRYFRPQGINIKRYKIDIYTLWGNLVWSSTRLTNNGGRPLEAWNGWLNNDKDTELLPSGTYIWKASATFIDNTVWKGMDDGDGNLKTSGVLTLIR